MKLTKPLFSTAAMAVIACALSACGDGEQDATRRAMKAVFERSSAGKFTYSYHPDSPLYLGGTFDAASPLAPKANPFNFEPSPPDTGAGPTNISLDVAFSESELRKKLKLDVDMDMNFLFAGGHFHHSRRSDTSVRREDLTLVLSAESNLPRRRVTITGVKPGVRDFSPDELLRRYGDQVITQELPGAQLTVVIRIKGIARQDRSSYATEIRAHGFGFSADTKFAGVFSSASESGRLSLQVHALGGAGFGPIGSALANIVSMGGGKISLKTIADSLGMAMGSFTPGMGAPRMFWVEPLSNYGLNPSHGDATSRTDEQTEMLSLAAQHYRVALGRYDEINNILNPYADSRSNLLPETVTLLKKDRTTLEQELNRLRGWAALLTSAVTPHVDAEALTAQTLMEYVVPGPLVETLQGVDAFSASALVVFHEPPVGEAKEAVRVVYLTGLRANQALGLKDQASALGSLGSLSGVRVDTDTRAFVLPVYELSGGRFATIDIMGSVLRQLTKKPASKDEAYAWQSLSGAVDAPSWPEGGLKVVVVDYERPDVETLASFVASIDEGNPHLVYCCPRVVGEVPAWPSEIPIVVAQSEIKRPGGKKFPKEVTDWEYETIRGYQLQLRPVGIDEPVSTLVPRVKPLFVPPKRTN